MWPFKKAKGMEVLVVEGTSKVKKPRAKARLERLERAVLKHGTIPDADLLEMKVLKHHLKGSE